MTDKLIEFSGRAIYFNRNGELMKLVLILLSFTLLNIVAFGRAPAVEDFVGVETESYKELKKNERFAYDFSGDPAAPVKNQEGVPSSLFSVFALLAFISLPIIMWMAMNFAIETKKEDKHTGTPDNVSYVDFKNKDDDQDKLDKAS